MLVLVASMWIGMQASGQASADECARLKLPARVCAPAVTAQDFKTETTSFRNAESAATWVNSRGQFGPLGEWAQPADGNVLPKLDAEKLTLVVDIYKAACMDVAGDRRTFDAVMDAAGTKIVREAALPGGSGSADASTVRSAAGFVFNFSEGAGEFDVQQCNATVFFQDLPDHSAVAQSLLQRIDAIVSNQEERMRDGKPRSAWLPKFRFTGPAGDTPSRRR